MSTKTELLKLLSKTNDFISGQEIANQLGISRAAVNQAASQLKTSGYNIISRTKVGYKLIPGKDIITPQAVLSHISRPCNIIVKEKLTSTNDFLNDMKLGSTPTCVIALEQTAGRGRMGRSFFSPNESGLYLSLAFKPSFQLDKGLFITLATAVAVSEAIEEVTLVKPKVKWVNDIFLAGKKIGGILTEAKTNFETGQIEGIIIGIGLNCFPLNKNTIPNDIVDIVGSISEQKESFPRSELAGKLIDKLLCLEDRLDSPALLTSYKRRCFIIGKTVKLHKFADDKTILAKVLDIDTNGGLVVEYAQGRFMKEIETITSAEISLTSHDPYSV